MLKRDNNYYNILNYNSVEFFKGSFYYINLDDIDKGKKKLTKIEKWKRKVILKRNDYFSLNLFQPKVYFNFIIFYSLLNEPLRNELFYGELYEGDYENCDKICRGRDFLNIKK